MKVETFTIDGPLLLTPKVFVDSRGFFLESWNQSTWNNVLVEANQLPIDFVQDNHSRSNHGVLRGLHYQCQPNPQGKLVRCLSGEIFDLAVDLRKESAHFGRYISTY